MGVIVVPMPFHRLAATRPPWLTLAEVVLVVALAVLLQVVALQAAGGFPLDDALLISTTLPAPFIAAWLTKRNPLTLLSVDQRIRWAVALRAVAAAIVVYGTAAVIAAARGRLIAFDTHSLAFRAVVLTAAVVLAQSAAEEVIFRALLPQAVGRWAESAWVAYGVPAVLFLPLHVSAGWGFVDIAVFAACACWLTWFTGGIEAATALHAAGNLLVAFAPVAAGASIALTLAATALIAWFVSHPAC